MYVGGVRWCCFFLGFGVVVMGKSPPGKVLPPKKVPPGKVLPPKKVPPGQKKGPPGAVFPEMPRILRDPPKKKKLM